MEKTNYKNSYFKNDTLYKKIKYAKIPTKEENKRLVQRAKYGDEFAKEELIIRNGKLVYSIYINKFKNEEIKEDLLQEGFYGLMMAINNFDETKDSAFSSYAYVWITKYMSKCNMQNLDTIHYPEHITEDLIKMNRAKAELEKKGLPLTSKNIINISGIFQKSYNKICNLKKTTSLNKQFGEEAETTVEDFIPDNCDIEKDIIKKEVNMKLYNIMKKELNLRDFDMICMRYGINYDTCYTLQEIGNKYNLSRERVRDIITQKIKILGRNEEILQLA